MNLYANDELFGQPIIASRIVSGPTCSWLQVDLATGEVYGPGKFEEPGCELVYEITTAGGTASATFTNWTMISG